MTDAGSCVGQLVRERQSLFDKCAALEAAGSSFEASGFAFSDFADRALEVCLLAAHRELYSEFCDSSERCRRSYQLDRSQIIPLAMGKWASRELNPSSDIDLIWLYHLPVHEFSSENNRSFENEKSSKARRNPPLDAAQIASWLRRTSQLLRGEPLGRLFRVDHDLRPEGRSGSLTLSLETLLHYWLHRAKAWERIAYLRARVVDLAGTLPIEVRDTLEFSRRDFVLGQHPGNDASDVKSIVGLARAQIEAHCQKTDLDIKNGFGGIRDAEFWVHYHQMRIGKEDPDILSLNVLDACDRLIERSSVSPSAAREVKRAYSFLRSVEHRLQYENDQQVFRLPEDPVACSSFLGGLWKDHRKPGEERDVHRVLQGHRETLRLHFSQAMEDLPELTSLLVRVLCRHSLQPEVCERIASRLGLHNATILAETLTVLKGSGDELSGVKSDLERHLMWILLHQSAGQKRFNFENLLIAILRTYTPELRNLESLNPLRNLHTLDSWEFLSEVPTLMQSYLTLAKKVNCEYQNWCSVEKPDWAIASRRDTSHRVASEQGTTQRSVEANTLLQKTLQRRTLWAPIADSTLSWLRGEFHLERHLENCTLSMRNLILTESQCLFESLFKHGKNMLGLRESLETTLSRTTLVLLGALGEGSMGFGSDLDLMFVYEGVSASENDRKSAQSVHRATQRIAREWLAQMRERWPQLGIDMRLRPFGESGELAISTQGFRKYQEKQARFWEHLAWGKASSLRFGEWEWRSSLGEGFEKSIKMPPDLGRLLLDHRTQMVAELQCTGIHAKFGVGGLFDIEVTTQAYFKSKFNTSELWKTWNANTTNPRFQRTLNALAFLREHDTLRRVSLTVLEEGWSFWRHLIELCRIFELPLELHRAPLTHTHLLPFREVERRMRIFELLGAKESLYDGAARTAIKVREVVDRILHQLSV